MQNVVGEVQSLGIARHNNGDLYRGGATLALPSLPDRKLVFLGVGPTLDCLPMRADPVIAVGLAQVPFTKNSRPIPQCLEVVSHGGNLKRNTHFFAGEATAWTHNAGHIIFFETETLLVFPCQHSGTRRATHGRIHIELRKANTGLGQSIEMRCFEFSAALKTEICIAGIIRKQQHNVRLRPTRSVSRSRKESSW